MKNDSEYLWTTEKDKYILVKSDRHYLVIGMIYNTAMIIEDDDDDEHEYIINMMLKNGNKVFDWETYKMEKQFHELFQTLKRFVFR